MPTKKVDMSVIDPEAEVPRGRCPLKKRGEEKDPLPVIGILLLIFLPFYTWHKNNFRKI